MILSITIIALAFYWLLRETDYLRVNLIGVPDLLLIDYELDYDGSDSVYLSDYEYQYLAGLYDYLYELYRDNEYPVKYRRVQDSDMVDYRDRHLKKMDKLDKARMGYGFLNCRELAERNLL